MASAIIETLTHRTQCLTMLASPLHLQCMIVDLPQKHATLPFTQQVSPKLRLQHRPDPHKPRESARSSSSTWSSMTRTIRQSHCMLAARGRSDGERADIQDPAEGSGSAPQRKESRKKVKKACVFCKRSHMPCEEARPCKRCVKRGISHLCRDAEPVGAAGAASALARSPRLQPRPQQPRASLRKHARMCEQDDAKKASRFPTKQPSLRQSQARTLKA